MSSSLPIINQQDENWAKKILEDFYQKGFIPAEKKNYLTQLRASNGPFVGIKSAEQKTHYLLDAASQIATLGLGLNPRPFFGVAHIEEAWLSYTDSKNFNRINAAFHSLMKRTLHWDEHRPLYLTYTNSGAEANETALGECYLRRRHAQANKVLAFEGSFHGRMMATLAATWNKSKREPFEWPGFEAVYCTYPELQDDQFDLPRPAHWRETWDNSPHKNFALPKEYEQDAQVAKECQVLQQVRQQLLSKNIFAVIIEPMQCEGGDRYGSGRFYEALCLLARAHGVAIIFDEVQTGFHLGRQFFWFRQFNMHDSHGTELLPDYIVCAKKAQVGLVISANRPNFYPEFQVASVCRGLTHGVALTQLTDKILLLENECRLRAQHLVKKYSAFLERPRACGISFAFDVKDATLCNTFITKRFERGLLYYPAGDRTLRFRLNTAFGAEEIQFLFNQLDALCQEIFLQQKSTLPQVCPTVERGIESLYAWHEYLLELQIDEVHKRAIDPEHVTKKVVELMNLPAERQLIRITKDNFPQYQDSIMQLQKEVYEPVRQTPLEVFKATIEDNKNLAFVITDKEGIMAIAFGSRPKNYPLESALRSDPYFHDEHTLYMVDVTVRNDLQNDGLGRNLKYAVACLAVAYHFKRINGKNRDHLARGMLNINLSLGAFELFFRKEHYLDFEKGRDLFYYTTPLTWEKHKLKLSDCAITPLGTTSISKSYVKDQLPYVVNKVCLSNFVSERFLSHFKAIMEQFPPALRSGYSTSGQSECVDKIAKSLWATGRKKNKILTFEGHYFGQGSMLSRSLSFTKKQFENYFPTEHLPHPTEQNKNEVLAELEKKCAQNDLLAIFLEPLPQKLMAPIDEGCLQKILEIAKKYKVPVIYNETGSQKFHYSQGHYFASSIPYLIPDGAFCYLGGQAGIIGLKREHFLEKALMLISTWDGDEMSFAHYHFSMTKILNHLPEYLACKKIFHKSLTHILGHYDITPNMNLGVGRFKGHLPHRISNYFKMKNGYWLVHPSWDAMKGFLQAF